MASPIGCGWIIIAQKPHGTTGNKGSGQDSKNLLTKSLTAISCPALRKTFTNTPACDKVTNQLHSLQKHLANWDQDGRLQLSDLRKYI